MAERREGPANPRPAMTGFRRRLVIMVKDPEAGRVKTRLGRDIDVAAATGFYRHTLASVTAPLARDPRWQTLLSVAPARAVYSRLLPPGIPRLPQHGGDLGARMQAIFDQPGAGPTVIIGTDIPEVRPAHIAAAFRALGNHDAVFGPATDGGFWLVGLSRTPRVIAAFGAVRWSTSDTLADCLDGLSGHRIATVATLRDADDAADLKPLRHILGRRILAAVPDATLKIDIHL